jgi:diguanylate cyclase (GGDEF)-like protein
MKHDLNLLLQTCWANNARAGITASCRSALMAMVCKVADSLASDDHASRDLISRLAFVLECDTDGPDVDRDIASLLTMIAQQALRSQTGRASDRGPQAVFLAGFCDESTEVASYLTKMGVQLATFGHFQGITDAMDALAPAHMIVVGSRVLHDQSAMQSIRAFVNQENTSRLIVLVAERDLSFEDRRVAAAMGKIWLFGQGDELKHLRDLIRSRNAEASIDGYKVLLVEDSRVDAHVAMGILKERGLLVQHIQRPSQVLEAIRDFRPDIIISDLHMPGCKGDVMARVIRQDRDATMPIVFLSSESNEEAQLLALANGADGFVQKPLQAEAFIAALKSIISRSISLENRMRRDPLTNLLNHGQFMETVRRCLANAEACSLVTLDIDHFKSVNDTHGHPVGDRVLVSIAELLTDGLRASDYVGRVGGEEFSVLMMGATPDQAVMIMDRLRERFSRVEHANADGQGFTCTFSAGVTSLSGSVMETLRIADAALYVSKREGRNRVTLSSDHKKSPD